MDLLCKNCKSEVVNHYCSVCGQSNNTHRFSIKHFFLHDFLHGVFHLDKGFVFTLKELFTRPGNSIREYVQGRRKDYFNFFTLLIIIIATGHYIGKIPKISLAEVMESMPNTRGQVKVLKEYGKYAILAKIPIFAFVTYVLFLKSKQNYSEHLVMTMYFTCAILVFHIFPVIFSVFTSDLSTLLLVTRVIIILEYIYYFWFLYQYFSVFYKSKIGLIFRCLTTLIFLLFANALVSLILSYIGNNYL